MNLIGDHTDYQSGLVLPMALELGCAAAGTAGGDRVCLVSEQLAGTCDVAADGSTGIPASLAGWTRYAAAVVAVLAELGRPAIGLRGTVSSDVPIGGGLSSSAALEVAVALALSAAAAPGGWSLGPADVALACQRAERLGTGVPCGVMDQLVAVLGEPGRALMIDCRDLVTTPVALPEGLDVLVVDSGVERTLAGSGYRKRHDETFAAAAHLGRASLRDATSEDLADLPPLLLRRARHVVTENERVRLFADAARAGDFHVMGDLMSMSHRSLRDDFESSHPGVDALCEALEAMPGVFGARITGGGFGGNVVALARRGSTVPMPALRIST